MLAKINLKTACGCTRVLYERVHELHYKYDVPIRVTLIGGTLDHAWVPPETMLTRTFGLVRRRLKSTVRTELWYEEVVYG